MGRATVILTGGSSRDQAAHWVAVAPPGTTVTFNKPARTLPQNARMWAMLTDIARQVLWPPETGISISTEDWKLLFLDALKREVRMIPNLDGNGFVNIGRSSSDLSKEEMTDMIELMFAFGAKHGVLFRDEETPHE